MEITIRFHSVSICYNQLQDGKMLMTIKEDTRVKDVLKRLNMLQGEIGLVIINSKIVSEETILSNGDIMELYPILGGG